MCYSLRPTVKNNSLAVPQNKLDRQNTYTVEKSAIDKVQNLKFKFFLYKWMAFCVFGTTVQ
jgi:hypothetical protein